MLQKEAPGSVTAAAAALFLLSRRYFSHPGFEKSPFVMSLGVHLVFLKGPAKIYIYIRAVK